MAAIVACLLLLQTPTEAPVALERVGTLAHEPIREASGIVRSRRYSEVYWVHNDSENLPLIFAVRRDGSLIREYKVAIPNVDWEDIAIDDRGHLYIGEIGNNGGMLPLRAVYQIDEPDPFHDETGERKLTGAWYYRFQPDRRFDAESLVIDGDRALIVAKTFDRRDAEIYAIPLKSPAPLLRPIVPEKVGVLPGFTHPATGAGLSADGQRLVVCSYDAVAAYDKLKPNDKDGWALRRLLSFESDNQIEAVAWDGDDVLLAGENRGIFRIRRSVWNTSAPRSAPVPKRAKPVP